MHQFKFNLLALVFVALAGSVVCGPVEAVQPIFYFDIDVQATATQLGNGDWFYEYTLVPQVPTGEENYSLKDLSNWWIELPEEKIPTLSDYQLNGQTIDVDNQFAVSVGPFATENDEKVIGVKWDSSVLGTYSFVSTHAPVLDGNGQIDPDAYQWFAKSGNPYFDLGRTLGPNGHTTPPPGAPVPEPTTLLLFGTGLAGLAVRKRR